MKPITTTLTVLGVAAIMVFALMIAGCGGGNSPALPDQNQTGDTGARAALMAFADACVAQNLDAAGGMLYDPASDRPFIDLIRDALPFVGSALKTAQADTAESDCVLFRYRLPDPTDPAGSPLPAFLYCMKVGADWRVSFTGPPMTADPLVRTSQWQTTTHWPILTGYVVDYYCSHYPQDTAFVQMLADSNSDFRNQVGLGSFEEDTDGMLDGIDRTAAHFMAPMNQFSTPPTPQFFKSLTDHGNDPGSVLPGIDTLDWALGNGQLQTGKGMLTNDYTFPLAVMGYLKAQGMSGDQKTKALKDAFLKFGHVLHLMEDMTCPAHTRNDQHNFLTTDNDPFEDWAAIYNIPLMAQTPSIYSGSIAPLGAIPRDTTGFPNNSLLQSFYNLARNSSGNWNAPFRAHPGVSALFWYSCWMSNHLGYTEDTIYQSTVPVSVDTTDYPILTRYSGYGLDFMGTPGPTALGSLKTLGIVSGGAGEYLVGTGTAKCYPWMVWYYFKHWKWPSIGTIISGEENGSGLITVADTRDIALSGVREQQYKLQFPLIVLTGAALLHEYYLESVPQP
jgi:hypothetical protein